MLEALELAARVALIGLGATVLLDLWSLLLKTSIGAPFPNYAMVGRWIGNFPRGQFAHASMVAAPSVARETLIGWFAHYVIGILYACLLVALAGVDWLRAPTLLPALGVGIATLAAPFLVMQPAMGAGIASSKAPNPNIARLRSIAAHTVFGLGLYVTALVIVRVW
jgi:hypothetical protein